VSMGGMIAQRFAVRHGRRVHTLGIGCTHFGGKRVVRPGETAWQLLQLKPGPGESLRDVARKQEPVYFHPEFVRTQRTFIEAFYDRMEPFQPPTHVLKGHITAIEAFDGYDDLPRIAVPTLVITGDADKLIVPENSTILAERIPGAKLVVLPQANHLFWLEKPQEAARAIVDFIGGA